MSFKISVDLTRNLKYNKWPYGVSNILLIRKSHVFVLKNYAYDKKVVTTAFKIQFNVFEYTRRSMFYTTTADFIVQYQGTRHQLHSSESVIIIWELHNSICFHNGYNFSSFGLYIVFVCELFWIHDYIMVLFTTSLLW